MLNSLLEVPHRRNAGSTWPGSLSSVIMAALLCAANVACNQQPASSRIEQSAQEAQELNTFWIAVTKRNHISSHGVGEFLVPIGRFHEGLWDHAPWTEGLSFNEEAGIKAEYNGDGIWTWPDANSSWRYPGRNIDTLGRTSDLIATQVPRTWFLYEDEYVGHLLSPIGLELVRSGCGFRWAIRVAEDAMATDEAKYTFRLPGVAVSHRPSKVLTEDDIPNLEEIKRAMGFIDRERRGEGYRKYTWLAIFRFDNGSLEHPDERTGGNTTLGILFGGFYEGSRFYIIQLSAEVNRVLYESYGGGC